MISQERNEYCTACWKLEDAGLVSDRQLKNSALDFYWDKDIRYIEDEARQGKYSPIMIKNTTSNTCNSTCVTCGSGSSTAWAPLEKKLGIIPIQPKSMTTKQITKNLNFKDIVTLNLVGGEPLYEKLNFYILSELLAHGNDKCFIAITTNGSASLTTSQKTILSKFKNLNFNVSIDGVGPVFEYLRYPLKWDSVLTNLEFFRTITNNVSVSYTTSNLNVLYHQETIKWFNEQKLNYHFNPIIKPSHFRPGALPKTIKDAIFSKFGRPDDLKFFLASHSPNDDIDFQSMLTVVKQQDEVKGISMVDYLPELNELILTAF